MEHLTEDELVAWEERHDEVVVWGRRWGFVTIIIFSAALTTIVLDGSSLATVVLNVLGGVGLLAQFYYHRKHMALHVEIENDQ